MSAFARMDQVLADFVDSKTNGHDVLPNGIAAIATDADGIELFRSKAGELGYDTQAPFFSCSKMVTPVLLLQLVQQGIIKDLHDEIPTLSGGDQLGEILTSFDEDGKPVLEKAERRPTWFELANHTSGSVYYFESALFIQYQVYKHGVSPVQQTLGYENYKGPLVFAPGSAYTYSGGMGVIGLLIKDITGHDLDYYLQKNICEPLGMKQTTFYWPEDMSLTWPIREKDSDITSPWKTRDFHRYAECLGDATICSTANDFSLFATEVLKAVSSKPNKFFKDNSIVETLRADKMTDVARESLYKDIKPRWQTRPIGKDWEKDEWHFGMGYLVNHKDISSGRKANSMLWDGMFGSYAIIDSASGIALHVFIAVFNVLDPTARRAHDVVEAEFYKCLAKHHSEK